MGIKGLTAINFVFSRNYIFYAQVAKDLVQNLMRGFNKYIAPPHLGESSYLLTWIKFSNNIINFLAKYHRQDGDPNKSFEGFEKPINRNVYILLILYYILYENSYRFCHSRRIFSG